MPQFEQVAGASVFALTMCLMRRKGCAFELHRVRLSHRACQQATKRRNGWSERPSSVISRPPCRYAWMLFSYTASPLVLLMCGPSSISPAGNRTGSSASQPINILRANGIENLVRELYANALNFDNAFTYHIS
jgi:hypothetical protein